MLLPGAVWVGASADGIFAGVVAAGPGPAGGPRPVGAGRSAGCCSASRCTCRTGFVLVGLLALAVLALRAAGPGPRAARRRGRASSAVTAVFVAAGFRWWDGYHLVVERYYQGWAADRPYGYWVWANLAALLLCAGPVARPGAAPARVAGRSRRTVRARPPSAGAGPATGPARADATPGPTVLLPLAAALAVARR